MIEIYKIERVNLKKKLQNERKGNYTKTDVLEAVQQILARDAQEEATIMEALENGDEYTTGKNDFVFDLLKSDHIFHIDQIQKICITYRLRFLDSQFFKASLPQEAIQKIKKLQKAHQTTLSGFKIVAPSKSFKLANADDPLLFAPIGNGYYYLIHKWGNDLHPLRKFMAWHVKTLENFLFSLAVFSLAVTFLLPRNLFTLHQTSVEFLIIALFMFKSLAGVALYYGFAKGKNFNTAIWKSKYYNA